jgi:hypothetical protein
MLNSQRFTSVDAAKLPGNHTAWRPALEVWSGSGRLHHLLLMSVLTSANCYHVQEAVLAHNAALYEELLR